MCSLHSTWCAFIYIGNIVSLKIWSSIEFLSLPMTERWLGSYPICYIFCLLKKKYTIEGSSFQIASFPWKALDGRRTGVFTLPMHWWSLWECPDLFFSCHIIDSSSHWMNLTGSLGIQYNVCCFALEFMEFRLASKCNWLRLSGGLCE